eukprot:TRINITY_DN39371_c0_g1_i1.p1 TRINITY_DN39371_c0_g1~~TRINITY_DN39371_c0_g1_i1.p1  ORF type:complete len:986 (-),score=218.19 TRINITY_DN39371_c0_g1_i1:66-2957(-)
MSRDVAASLTPDCPGALLHGYRLGSPVEVEGAVDLNARLGQLVSFSEKDGTFNVCFVNGSSRQVRPENLSLLDGSKRPGLGGGPESFDVLVGPRHNQDYLAEEVATCLMEKGFCVLKICQKQQDVEQAVSCVRTLRESGKLQRLPEEVEEGYLGLGARALVAWMDPSDLKNCPQDKTLKESDDFMSTIMALLQPYCQDALGKAVDARTPGLVSLSLDPEEDIEPAPADDFTLASFYSTWQRSHVKLMHFMGPGKAQVTLTPKEEEGVAEDVQRLTALPCKQETTQLSACSNTIVLYRPNVFDLACFMEEETLVLSAALLEHMDQLFLSNDNIGDMGWLRCIEGPPGPKGDVINVVNLSTRLMAKWDEPEAYRAGLNIGCDASVEIPFTRWDIEEYYTHDADNVKPMQTWCKHQTYVEGLELFDHKYFEIPANEARSMDPMQRQILETGAQNLFKMGITKQFSSRNPHHAGVSVGLDKDDWDLLPKPPECQGGANVQAIISNRFSFVFNLRGPNYVADTACSASLTATHLAKFMLMDQVNDKLQFHVALGIHQCLSPLGFIGASQSHMISPLGRCLTFNATASGYLRGDGCSGMVLKPGDLPDEREAVWRGSMVGQNGRSATLTAPNGLSQEEVIWKAIREAKISPTESCVWSCHGTGTSLGDPIEVGAVRKVQNKEERPTTLLVVTNKPMTGHLEGGAAMTSLIAACFQVKSSNAVPVCHLRQLNPHLDQTTFSAVFNSELNSYHYSQGHVHVSSFGFGGTNGHAVFWGENVYNAPSDRELFQKRLWKMSPPEVRVNGSDPALWDWDGPDPVILPGDKYSIEMDPEDPPDAAQRWFKEATATEQDDGEEDIYCITGPFNEWDLEEMEDGPVPGLRTIVVTVPYSGQVEFRILKNGNEDEVIYPEKDKCSRKLMQILGPASTDMGREKNTWLAEGTPASKLKIDFFSCRGIRSINWMQVVQSLE